MKKVWLSVVCAACVVLGYIGIDLCDEFDLWEKNETIATFVHTAKLDNLIKNMEKAHTQAEKLQKAIEADKYATRHRTLYLSSDAIEKVFTDEAKLHSVELSKEVIKNSICHVATELYNSGGHTRVIERWVERAPTTERHFLIMRTSFVPNRLQKAINDKNGEILYLPENVSDIEIAMALRQMASSCERIVLHVHMDDYIPLIAFGTDEFTRPVLFFNHADHVFWLGVSIADNIINFREYGKILTEKYRGGMQTSLLKLPIDTKLHHLLHDKKYYKDLFGFDQNKKIVFTSGAKYKFDAEGDIDYSIFMKKLFERKKDIFFVLIGASPTSFKHLDDISQQNYKFFNVMPNDEYIQYLATADVVIDSMPMGGGLALTDAVSLNIPVLSLKSKYQQIDFIIHSKAYKDSIDELVSATIDILTSESKKEEYLADVKYHLSQEDDIALWKNNVETLYKNVTTHQVHPFKSIKHSYKEFKNRK